MNDAGTLVASDFDDGSTDPALRGQIKPEALSDDPNDPNDPPAHAPGELIAHFSYGGLGYISDNNEYVYGPLQSAFKIIRIAE